MSIHETSSDSRFGKLFVKSIRPERQAIAPLWHTCILIIVVILLAIVGLSGSGTTSPPPPAIPFYLGAIAFEWLMFAYVWWGIRMRGNSLITLVRADHRTKLGRDALIGIVIWVVWYLIESLIALGLTAIGLTNTGATGTVFPHGVMQVGLWILMAVSSGISEEITFRGYFLRQFSAWTGSATLGIILQAVLFGIGHAYLGVRQSLLIVVSGVLLGIFAIKLRNLRPLIITHAWADVFGGLILRGLPY